MHTRKRISELAVKSRVLAIAVVLVLLAVPAFAAGPWPVSFIAGPNGSISGTASQSVPDLGSSTPVSAVSATTHHFVNWTGTGGFVTTTANPLTVSNVTGTMVITANFNLGPATMNLPDYSMPLLTPASQEGVAWTNVVPNALAAYFTYSPYSAATASAAGFPATCGVSEDCYTISARKFQQQLALPSIFAGGGGLLDPSTGLPFGAVTWVHGYGSASNAPAVGPLTGSLFHFPAPTIRGTQGRPIRIQWLNELPNEKPVGHDPTVDGGPNAPNNYPYNRIVTHVHGAHVTDDSDGFAEAWYTPNFLVTGTGWRPSTHGPEGTYKYPMDQEAATIWYHDHASGLTHLNTQMGLAGFFPITDANEQALIAGNILPTGNYELGFALQDRMFDTNGQFAMPDFPVYDSTVPGCIIDLVTGLPDPVTCAAGLLNWMKALDGHLIPYVPGDPLLSNPINAGAPFPASSTTLEYFGNMPVVNGVTYGKYDVEPRVYRMRFIGGTDSRTWIMQLVSRTTGSVIPFWQIASEQGFLNNPVSRDTMDLMPGERLDVLVDLTGIAPGTKVVMKNLGADSPYGGPASLLDPLYVASVDIPEIMEFDVVALAGADNIVRPCAPTNLRPLSGPIAPLVATPGVPVRKVALEEITDQYGRTMPTIDQRPFMMMGVPATEVVRLNDTEEWNIINTTVDAHPMHLHLVQFQVVSRQTFTSFVSAVTNTVTGTFGQPSFTPLSFATTTTSNAQGVEPWEAGWKDTIDCPPGLVTTIRAKFDIAGDKYVWHCHILSHEEHDMMRPLRVVAPSKIGFYDPATHLWYLDLNGNGAWDGTPTDAQYFFGYAGTLPVAGSWTGTGSTKIGIYDSATFAWYLDVNANGAWDGQPTDKYGFFGLAGGTPVVGDWSGNGIAKIGMYLNNSWYLDVNGNGYWDGEPTDKYGFFGLAGSIPVVGDWNADGKMEIGVYDPATTTWYLDTNGNGVWDGTPIDTQYTFGIAGGIPITGKW